MKSRHNLAAMCLGWGLAAIVAASCASSEEGVFDNTSASDGSTTETGTGGTATGGSGGSWGGSAASSGSAGTWGGTGGTGTGGAGTGGTGGTGGTSTGGTGAKPGTGGTSSGSCNPAFCPNTGSGTPCCVTPNGPCGTQQGSGPCQSTPTGDF